MVERKTTKDTKAFNHLSHLSLQQFRCLRHDKVFVIKFNVLLSVVEASNHNRTKNFTIKKLRQFSLKHTA